MKAEATDDQHRYHMGAICTSATHVNPQLLDQRVYSASRKCRLIYAMTLTLIMLDSQENPDQEAVGRRFTTRYHRDMSFRKLQRMAIRDSGEVLLEFRLVLRR